MDGEIFLVIIGVLLILAGVVLTPVYQPLGNAAFWLGVVMLFVGMIIVIARSR